MKKARKSELVSVRIYCPKLKKNVVVKANIIDWSACDQDCEMCGSHGDVSASIKCKCGKYHEIELKSW